MTLIEIIKQLKKEGYKISYRRRTDGGYIITKIDGRRFSGGKGNTFARELLGIKISEARAYQLGRLNKRSSKQRKERLEKIPEDVKKQLQKIQRKWRKDHPTISGIVSTSNIRYFLKEHGKEATLMALDKANRYTQGYAYLENVQHLIERINLDLNKDYNQAMVEVRDLIENKKLVFKEDWLSPCYNVLYEWEKRTIDGNESARRIKSIIQ